MMIQSTKTKPLLSVQLLLLVVGLGLLSVNISFCNAEKILLPDFELTTEVGKYGNPTDIMFLKNGAMLAANKNGIVTVSQPNDYDNPQVALDIQALVCENGERGLLSITAHPDYGVDNPYIWIMYSFNINGICTEDIVTGPVNRLSRFTMDPTTYIAALDSEVVYMNTPALPVDHHNAGDVEIGKDYNIYITIGDGGESPTAQDPSNLWGVIVRLTLDNEIPPTNPYSTESLSLSANNQQSTRCNDNGISGDPTVFCQEIFAMGLRNPFRFAMNPNVNETQFYVNDVGASTWEEVSIGGTGYEGANYGWPEREGPCRHGRTCNGVDGNNNCVLDDAYNEPVHFYGHNAIGDGAITAGAFVPAGYWPLQYDGSYMYADFVFGQIFLMSYTGGLDHDACPAKSNYEGIPLIEFEGGDISSMAFGPHANDNGDDGIALYFMTRGFGGRLNRIAFTGTLNRSPQPLKINANVTSGAVGTIVQFDGTESGDPDGDTLTFEWDLDGDGVFESSGPVVSFQYNVEGLYNVAMKARDGKGGRATTIMKLGIGEHPIAVIVSPVEGEQFFVGEQFVLTGAGSDKGIASPDDAMMWEVLQHHSAHNHPYLDPTVGNSIQLQAAPSPEDFKASTNSYLEIILTVTNAIGLETIISRNVMPQLVDVVVDSIPSGLAVLIDNFKVTTPESFTTWENHPLKLEAVDPDPIDSPDLKWLSWSNGGDQTQFVTIPQGNRTEPLQFNAIFQTTVAPTPFQTTVAPTPSATPAPVADVGIPVAPTTPPVEPSASPAELTTRKPVPELFTGTPAPIVESTQAPIVDTPASSANAIRSFWVAYLLGILGFLSM